MRISSPGRPIVDWRAQSRAIPSVAAFRQLRYAFAGSRRAAGRTQRARDAESVRLLGVNAMLGRTFLDEEGRTGNDRVAILSRAFWQRHFGGARA